MRSGREELRRGVRDLIETASREMDELVETAPEAPASSAGTAASPAPSQAPARPAPATPETRPILRLVRDVPPPAPATPAPVDLTAATSKKGVCSAYYVNQQCWEVPDAFCNRALHVCMLRECPVYHLNRERLEQRFARKFAHLW